MSKIKVSDLLVEVSRVGNANPDVKYQDRVKERDPELLSRLCRYEVAGKPGCIVGEALSNLGVDIRTLTQLDDEAENGSGVANIVYEFADLFEVDDVQAVFELRDVQNCQDKGYSWGDSVEFLKW